MVRGMDWQGNGATVMNVGATHYSITQSESYDQMDALTNNDVSVMQPAADRRYVLAIES
jgi:hypothetical protein